MSLSRVWIIPFCVFFFSIAAFVLPYIIAVNNNHVKALWPYISDSGALPPESCIFAQLLNLSALFLAVTVYLRHRQIVEFYWHKLNQVGDWRKISTILLWVGYASAFGVTMVANFQEGNVIYVHYFGALMTFGCGLIYIWAQTVFSYWMNPKLATPRVSHFRLVLCIFSTIFFVMTVVFGPILGRQPYHRRNSDCPALYKWTGNEPNFYNHMIGTISEWMLAVCFQLYILSFAIELRFARCHAPKLELISFIENGCEPNMVNTKNIFISDHFFTKNCAKVGDSTAFQTKINGKSNICLIDCKSAYKEQCFKSTNSNEKSKIDITTNGKSELNLSDIEECAKINSNLSSSSLQRVGSIPDEFAEITLVDDSKCN